MKSKIYLALLVCVSLLLIVAFAKDFIYDTPQRCFETAAAKFGKNETLGDDFIFVYKINYMSLVSMGTLTFSKTGDEAGDIFRLEAVTDGSFVDAFVRASATLESFFDTATNLPVRYSETTNVKGDIKTKEIVFDRENNIALLGDHKIKIAENTYDPVGAFLTAIHFPYIGSQEYLLSLLSKKSLYLLRARRISTSMNFFEALIDVKRENLTSSHGASIKVWLTSNGPRIPLVIKSWTPAGYASVTLEEIRVKGER